MSLVQALVPDIASRYQDTGVPLLATIRLPLNPVNVDRAVPTGRLDTSFSSLLR